MIDTSGILKSIQGGGLKNPLSGITTQLNRFPIPTLGELTSLASIQAAAQGIAAPSSALLQSAHSQLNGFVSSANQLLDHSNKLSGVDLTGNQHLGAIASVMTANRVSDGTSICDGVLAAFGAIMKAAEFLKGITDSINSLIAFIEDIPNKINQMIDQLTSMVNKIMTQIQNDLNALANAMVALAQKAIANVIGSLLDDPCFGQVIGAVAGVEMQGELNKVKGQINAKKNAAMSGVRKAAGNVKVPIAATKLPRLKF